LNIPINNEYSGAIAQSVYGTGSVHYNDFSCTGRESTLTSCRHSIGSSCDYRYYRAGVYCYSNLHSLRESACKHTFSACSYIIYLMITYQASPTRFHATCTELNWCILIWQPPPIRQESIVNYFIDCSTHNRDARRGDRTAMPIYTNSYSMRLQPHQIYNCCVGAMNGAGSGNPICQNIITYETGKHYDKTL
jgi:hypothetical protein